VDVGGDTTSAGCGVSKKAQNGIKVALAAPHLGPNGETEEKTAREFQNNLIWKKKKSGKEERWPWKRTSICSTFEGRGIELEEVGQTTSGKSITLIWIFQVIRGKKCI